MTSTYLDNLHPALTLLYFGAVLVFTMSATHPTLLALSLISSIILGCWLRGGLSVLKTLSWQLPLLAIIIIINPLFSSSGTTELFRIGTQALYLESLVHASYMGCMLIAVMQWFTNASHVIGSEELMTTLGSFAPTISLMITMIGRLIPRFIEKERAITSSLSACTAAQSTASNSKKSSLSMHLRTISTLMSWSMEDSLESADSMKARGWGSVKKRTLFKRHCFSFLDAVALLLLLTLGITSALAAFALCTQFGFFPSIHGPFLSFSMVPYTLLFFFPLLLELYGKVRK